MKSHLQSYPCPLQINSFWNLGFLLGITIILQIITGIFLGLHYTSDLNSAYSSLFFIIREIFYGWCLRYLHSSGASFVFLFLFLHLGRAISYDSNFYNPNTWFSGIILFFFLMATAFMGYVLPFGQMSFWGATVITNLLSPFPCLIEWVSGGHYDYNPTLKRFFLFHFLLPFILCGFRILHLFSLHLLSSNNPLRNSTNYKIPFFPFIFSKDVFGLIIILCLQILQTHFGIFLLLSRNEPTHLISSSTGSGSFLGIRSCYKIRIIKRNLKLQLFILSDLHLFVFILFAVYQSDIHFHHYNHFYH